MIAATVHRLPRKNDGAFFADIFGNNEKLRILTFISDKLDVYGHFSICMHVWLTNFTYAKCL